MEDYYLKSNVRAEPLIWNWYAWSYLISPHTAASNIVNRHLKIMESYILAPQLHQQANQIPAMIGGPFIDLEGDKTTEIKKLIDETRQNCADLIDLFSALHQLNQTLLTHEKGYSLEPLYEQIPQHLKGLCELVYDQNHHPSLRLIEPLIYQKFYKNEYQSLILCETHSDKRPFTLSTPRVEDGEDVRLSMSFSDKRLDDLFAMRYQPNSLRYIADLLERKDHDFINLFTSTSPLLEDNRNYTAQDIRIRYFGHACVLIQSSGTSVLIDPLISYTYPGSIERFSLDSLPDIIDCVLITHNHQDHFSIETLLQLRHKIKKIIVPNNYIGSMLDPSLKHILKHLGFQNVGTLDEFETIIVDPIHITGLPFLGEHASLNIQTKLAYLLRIYQNKLCFVADSNNLDNQLYQHIHQTIGDIDTLFIGMECEGAPLSWLYGPLMTQDLTRKQDESRRLAGSDAHKAWSIVKTLHCRQAYVYAMGQEPWLSHIMALDEHNSSKPLLEAEKFIAQCRKENIHSERLIYKKEIILYN